MLALNRYQAPVHTVADFHSEAKRLMLRSAPARETVGIAAMRSVDQCFRNPDGKPLTEADLQLAVPGLVVKAGQSSKLGAIWAGTGIAIAVSLATWSEP